MTPARLPPSLGCYGHMGVAGLGDFEEVVRLQAGIRQWLLRTARNGRHELRGIPAPAVLPLLCAAAFGPALTEAADLGGAAAVASVGVLSSVGATALGDVLAQALDRVRSAHPGGDPSRGDVQREISRSVQEALSAGDPHADEVRSDVAMVLREIDAGGTVFRAAIEAGDEELEHEVIAAVGAVSAEFGELEFLLADLARAAGEIQDSLGGQGTELRAASEQVARQSADVRVIREELAVIEQRTWQWVPGSGRPGQGGPRWTDGCPYRGLLPYEQAHETVFYGRGRLVATLAGTLAQAGLVMMTGASGAGKTSLLQAGLVPALARGLQVPGSSSWPRIAMTPGTRPLTDLSDRLAQLDDRDPAVIRKGLADAPGDAHLLISEIVQAARAARLVLVVDQFEEIFAATGEDGTRERAAFIDAVCAAASRPAGPRGEPPALVALAVRGDYWDRCAAYPGLVRAMEHDHVVVGPMTDADLRQVITGPAEASGLTVEPDLVETILADLRSAADGGRGGPGVLPLLSQALMLTWERRDGAQLTRRGYADAGNQAGIARAIEVTAETAYRGLTEDQQAIAREAFRRMTAMGPDRRPVRRAATSRELHSGRPKSEWPEVDAVLEAFARGRLLVLDTDRAEIAHDVLLQAWPRLRGWLEEDETSMILYGQLAEDTVRWRSSEGDRALLYRGVQLTATLQAARVWDADPERYPALSTSEADFLRASGRALARGRWRRRALAGLLSVLVIAALAGAGIAVKNARTSAARQSTTNASQRLAAQSTALDASDPVTAALLAGAAWRLAPTAQARYSLLQSLAQPVRGVLTASSGVVTALAYSPDGATLAAGYSGGAIRLWDLASHQPISTTSWDGTPLALAFSGGGKQLEVADAAAVGTWNLTDRARITARPFASPAHTNAVAFSQDGQTVATGGADGNVRLWDAATGQEIGPPMSSDAKPVAAVTFSPDGTLVAAGSADGNVQLWDTATEQEAGTALVAGAAEVDALAFSQDGKLLATGGQDGAVRLWDVATGSPVGTTMATGDAVSALTFGAGGTTLASAESDGATELWNVTTQTQTGAALTVQGSAGVSALAFSPAADALATGNGNGSIQLWNPAGFSPTVRSAGARTRRGGRRGGRAHARCLRRWRRPARDQQRARDGPGVERHRETTGGPADRQLPRRDRARPQSGRQDPGRGRQRRPAVADRHRPADRQHAAAGRERAVPGRGVQPGRHDAGHPGRGRHGTDLGRGHPAAGRRADDRGRAGHGQRGGGVQPRRQDAGHGGRRRPGRAVERGHPPAARQAHGRGPRHHHHDGVQPRRRRAGHGGRRRQRPAVERDDPAGDRRADDRRRPAGLRGGVQSRRQHAGHRRRRRQRPALGRGHPAGDRRADDGRHPAGLRGGVRPRRQHAGHRRRRRCGPDLGRSLPGQPPAGRVRHRERIPYQAAMG